MGAAPSLPDYDPREHKGEGMLQLKRDTYPNQGLYTVEPITVDAMVQLDQQEQMRYSDAVTRRYALHSAFRLGQQRNIRAQTREALLLRATPTSIGNMACMAHWNPNSFWDKTYRELINDLKTNL
jgi:hypothetical protein